MNDNAVDSNGNFVRINMTCLHFAPEQKRLDAMNAIRLAILPYLRPFGANDKTFSAALQPFGYEDRLIWFTKIFAESDSDIVKRSQNALNNKNYIYADKDEEYLLRSVFPTTEDGSTRWYLLYAESLCFTHNIYDKKLISAVFEDPVPYYEFIEKNREMRISKREIVLEERTDKMKYLSAKIDFEDPVNVLDIALSRTDEKNLDAYFREGLKELLQAVEKRDKDSNRKTMLLIYLADNAVNEQEASRVCAEFGTWTGIASSKGNIITVSDGNDEADIFVCKEPDDQRYLFISKGNIFENTELLKEYIQSGQCFEKAPDWWDTILSMTGKDIDRSI